MHVTPYGFEELIKDEHERVVITGAEDLGDEPTSWIQCLSSKLQTMKREFYSQYEIPQTPNQSQVSSCSLCLFR
jgi:hypothetical protein